jgi:hypothetical protein
MIRNVARVLEVMHGGALVEIRAIGVPQKRGKPATWSGYFTNYQKAAAAAKECEDAMAGGVYCTLNTIHEGLIARAPNCLEKYPAHTTTDHEVLKHRWLLVDVDPIRPTAISSTATELAIAKTIRDEIASWLVEHFPERTVIRACSGNGYHALMRTSMSAQEKVEILRVIDEAFGCEEVKIDQSVFKPAQLTKLYGTWTRKGYDVPDRPHRRSFIELITEGAPRVKVSK